VGFRPIVAIKFGKVVLNFRDQFRRIGMRPHGWGDSFPHSPAVVQINLSSAKLQCFTELDIPSINLIYASFSIKVYFYVFLFLFRVLVSDTC
jgi:hypothetical protein